MSSSRLAPVQQIAVHLVLADHLRKREPQLGRAHRAGHGDEHLAAALQVIDIGLRRVDDDRGVEVAVVVRDEVLIVPIA